MKRMRGVQTPDVLLNANFWKAVSQTPCSTRQVIWAMRPRGRGQATAANSGEVHLNVQRAEPEGSSTRDIEAQTRTTGGGKRQDPWFWVLSS
jgi:hypothetical protein